MKIFRNIVDGFVKFVSNVNDSFGFKYCDGVKDIFGSLRCAKREDQLSGEKLRQNIAKEKKERDERIIALLEEIESRTRG